MKRSRGRTVAVCCVLLLGPWLGGCDSRRAAAETAILSFVSAVQIEDLDALYCGLYGASQTETDAEDAGVRRQTFDSWARSRFSAYLAGRDEGWVDLAGDGIVLTKAFALGKGTYYTLRSVRTSDDGLVVDMEVRLAYGEIDLGDLPPRTTFYLAGTPIGTIRAVRIPAGSGEIAVDVIDRILVRWTLVRSPSTAACPEGWAVARVEPLDETAITTEVVWEFGYY